MTQAQESDTVRVHYTGKLEDGTIFDTSFDQEPLEFTIGERQVIPGFEQAVVGMEPGETKTTTIPPEEAYGQRNDEMVLEVDREQLPESLEPQPGQFLQIQQPDGRRGVVTVSDVTETTVTLDANHPLAGRPLTFDIKLVEIVSH
ncbi:fkbp-type peptidyl-prolyl cis-trans isomerase slyd [hydrocarbon metagenome]|uniref:peptidylprolyl isomerase n=1 Tax=hydrocarbon metagenome TaxID=938273 RepID=A0A0W8FF67_9ZZZZ|nr:peptidylprolyl isomerase [Methanomicrobiaceae archaeon]